MPGSTVLDVVLGLGLVFFLLATLCAAIREGIGGVLETSRLRGVARHLNVRN